MRIFLTESINAAVSPPVLGERLRSWSEGAGFTLQSKTPSRWVYRRGSHWHAAYTFDIRKIPTEVVVQLLDGQGNRVQCSVDCGSWLQMETGWDRAKVQAVLDVLVAHLLDVSPWHPDGPGRSQTDERVRQPDDAVQKPNNRVTQPEDPD
jgi:hypothetical protein